MCRKPASSTFIAFPYLEVNSSTFVRIESSEDVFAKLVGVPGGEEHLVHLAEGVRGQLTIGTVLHHNYSALPLAVKPLKGMRLEFPFLHHQKFQDCNASL